MIPLGGRLGVNMEKPKPLIKKEKEKEKAYLQNSEYRESSYVSKLMKYFRKRVTRLLSLP